MKCVAIVVGHTANKGGAKNDNFNINEFQFNNELAVMIAHELMVMDVRPVIVYRSTYSDLPDHVNDTKADLCVSLHCNAFDKVSHGSEVLYFRGSKKGIDLAESIQSRVVNTLRSKDRGCKAIDYNFAGSYGDRGGYLVKSTKMPTVIVEPFFIDSDQALQVAMNKKHELAKSIAEGIKVNL